MKQSQGFTIVETVIGTAVFLIVAIGVYSSYVNLFRFMNTAQYQELAVDLAEEQMEIIRNMPYADVGVQGSIPNGNIPYEQTFLRGGVPFKVTTIVRNIDIPADSVAGGTPNDTAPNDNKLIALTISCDTCPNSTPFSIVGQIAPLSLESSGNTGSLFIHVYDAVGHSVQDADIVAVNNKGTTTITIHDVSDNTGTLALVGVPPGVQAYNVVVGKTGYSSDQTYPLGGAGNPNPINVDATVATGQVTNANFFIDRLASLAVSSVSPTCAPVPNFDFTLSGSKQIGTGVLKYSQAKVTNGSGVLSLSQMEWDTAYSITPTDTAYDLAGVNPASSISLNPGAAVNVQLVVVPKSSRALMVSVTDASTGLPLSGASVQVSGGAFSDTKVTGQGFLGQTDWSGGSGQAGYSATNQYWSDDSNVDVNTVPGDIRLRSAFGVYNPSGYLESSTFDTGTTSNFYNFVWSPSNEPASTSVKFQFATAASSSPSVWDFFGPDGTAATYYNVTNSSFHSSMNGKQYARYRAFLETATSSTSSNISDIGFTYTSACIPPGQVLFQGLSAGTYTITISKTGYNTVVSSTTLSTGWQELKKSLTQ